MIGFRLHAAKPSVEEVNFWKPSATATFKALSIGEPLLFKLHSPRNFIAGGGFFTKFIHLPLRLAWETFGESNGFHSLQEARTRIAQYKRAPIASNEDPDIGCIILSEPFFFPEDMWIPMPPDFAINIVTGKAYSTDDAAGRTLWTEVTERLQLLAASRVDLGNATIAAIETPRYGNPVPVRPRLGQGGFASWSRMRITGDARLRESELFRCWRPRTSSRIRKVAFTICRTGCCSEAICIGCSIWGT